MTIYPLGYSNGTALEVQIRTENRVVQAWVVFENRCFSSSRMPESFTGAAKRECFDRLAKVYRSAQFT